MKVTADKSECLSASLVEQTKETFFFFVCCICQGLVPVLFFSSRGKESDHYNIDLTKLYAKCIVLIDRRSLADPR